MMKTKLAAIGIGTALLAAATALGADIDATLDSADGTSALNVRDSSDKTLMSVASDGVMSLNSGADNDIEIRSEGTNIVIGADASAGLRSIAIGRHAVVGDLGLAMGTGSDASGNHGTALGNAA